LRDKSLWWNSQEVKIGQNRTYVGQWRKEKFEDIWTGLGSINFPDGSKYQGFTKNGLFHGKGRLTKQDGSIFQGEWREGKAVGYGVLVTKKGTLYEGNWLNDLYHGKGTEVLEFEKSRYSGEFVHGKKTGKGLLE
jgi:hypothetical protein